MVRDPLPVRALARRHGRAWLLRQPGQVENVRLVFVALFDIQAHIAAVESMTQMVHSMLGMLDAQMKTLQDELQEAALSRKDPKAYEPQPNPKKAALSCEQVIKMKKENKGSQFVIKVQQPRPRNFQIRKSDAEKHGYTRGCAGCSSWFSGLARQPHTTGCRDRFAALMKDEAKFITAEVRKLEFEDQVARKRTRFEDQVL